MLRFILLIHPFIHSVQLFVHHSHPTTHPQNHQTSLFHLFHSSSLAPTFIHRFVSTCSQSDCLCAMRLSFPALCSLACPLWYWSCSGLSPGFVWILLRSDHLYFVCLLGFLYPWFYLSKDFSLPSAFRVMLWGPFSENPDSFGRIYPATLMRMSMIYV